MRSRGQALWTFLSRWTPSWPSWRTARASRPGGISGTTSLRRFGWSLTASLPLSTAGDFGNFTPWSVNLVEVLQLLNPPLSLYTFPTLALQLVSKLQSFQSSHFEALFSQGLWLLPGSGTTPSASFPPRPPRSPRSSLATMGWSPASPGHHLRRKLVFLTILNKKMLLRSECNNTSDCYIVSGSEDCTVAQFCHHSVQTWLKPCVFWLEHIFWTGTSLALERQNKGNCWGGRGI